MDCRYYDSLPNVPYVKLSDYYKLWTGQDISIKNNNYGTYDLEVPSGFTGAIDANEDYIISNCSTLLYIPESELTSNDSLSDLYVNNSMKTAAAVVAAVTFMTIGAAGVYVSGIGRKKKDNE